LNLAQLHLPGVPQLLDPGAQAILNLRTLYRSGGFEQYWESYHSTSVALFGTAVTKHR
jgi:hypothetical protein